MKNPSCFVGYWSTCWWKKSKRRMDGGKLIYVSSRDEGLSGYDFKNKSKQRKDRTNLTPAHLLRAATLPVCLKHRVWALRSTAVGVVQHISLSSWCVWWGVEWLTRWLCRYKLNSPMMSRKKWTWACKLLQRLTGLPVSLTLRWGVGGFIPHRRRI